MLGFTKTMEDPFQHSKFQPRAEAGMPADNISVFPARRLKVWIISGGVFLILLFLILSYFYWRNNVSDGLIKLAPVDSVLYVHARDSLWPLKGRTIIADLPFSDFYQQSSQNFPLAGVDLENDLLNNSRQAAMVIIAGENLDLVFLFKLKTNPVESVLAKLPHYSFFDKNILAIAGSESALNKIKEVEAGSIFSLVSQIDMKKMGRGLMQLYVDSDNLRNYLNQKQDLPEQIFSQLTFKDSYLTMDKKGDQWDFKIFTEFLNPLRPAQQLADYLPKDFSVFFSSINLMEVFADQGQIFSDPFWQNIGYLEAVYNFDFKRSAEIFLNQPVDLIIFDDKKESVFGFDYIMFVPQTDKAEIEKLENLVRVILAQKLPRPVPHTLPDGSQVTELLADIDSWQWQKEPISNGLEISYLSEPAIKFEISYLTKDDKTIISSSRQLLKNFISDEGVYLKDLTSRCGKNIFGRRYIIFNSNNIFSRLDIYLPDGITLVRETEKDLRGCIIDFD